MNKASIFRITLLVSTLLALVSCRRNGGSTVYTAIYIGDTPVREEKKFRFEGRIFTYFNVYNDGENNFVLADEDSYIRNEDLKGPMKTKTQYLYTIPNEDEEPEWIEPELWNDDEGYYHFYITKYGFEIRGSDIFEQTEFSDLNIGHIVKWC